MTSSSASAVSTSRTPRTVLARKPTFREVDERTNAVPFDKHAAKLKEDCLAGRRHGIRNCFGGSDLWKRQDGFSMGFVNLINFELASPFSGLFRSLVVAANRAKYH